MSNRNMRRFTELVGSEKKRTNTQITLKLGAGKKNSSNEP